MPSNPLLHVTLRALELPPLGPEFWLYQRLLIAVLTVAVLGLAGARVAAQRLMRRRIAAALQAAGSAGMVETETLSRGRSARVLVDGDTLRPLSADVHELDKRGITLRVRAANDGPSIEPGSAALVLVPDNEDALQFHGVVLETLRTDSDTMVYLQRPPWLARFARRRHMRATAKLPATVSIVGPHMDGPALAATVEDLSRGGIRLSLQEALPRRALLRITVQAADGDELWLRARVRSCEPAGPPGDRRYVARCELADVAAGELDRVGREVQRRMKDEG